MATRATVATMAPIAEAATASDPGRRRRLGLRVLALALALFLSIPGSRVSACFETIPGRAPAAMGDWGWILSDDAFASGARDATKGGWTASLGFAQPAQLAGLSWGHATLGLRRRKTAWQIEAFTLACEDLYREEAAGVSCRRGPLCAGVRLWRVAWGDRARAREGAAFTFGGTLRAGPLRFAAVAQDMAIGPTQSSAPVSRFVGSASVPLAPTLAVESAIAWAVGSPAPARAPAARAGISWWGPQGIRLVQIVRLPDLSLAPALEIRVRDRLRVGIWSEPASSLGTRWGVQCAFD
ncbi:MAG: hypothetical protein QUU85_17535 [Candidatus Eisenbacteria bacterium]|nr:hypothetical protein [Candidatus Eisenbacteria bacterium]